MDITLARIKRDEMPLSLMAVLYFLTARGYRMVIRLLTITLFSSALRDLHH
jgi:hypothetical protein